MLMNQIEKYATLLNNLRQIPGFSTTFHLSDLLKKFENFLSEFSNIRGETIKEARTIAPEFNIFDLLGVTRNEVSTHSAMLAELLNPAGSHGQGSLFLDSFVGICLEKDSHNQALQQFVAHTNRDLCSVMPEYHTSYGRMDIVVLNPAIGFLCVIENKVGAGEQSQQLERYSNWMKSMHSDYPLHTLVFLTIRGYVAASAGNEEYIPISYNRDIINWLERAVPYIQAPIVKAAVQQYCEISRRL